MWVGLQQKVYSQNALLRLMYNSQNFSPVNISSSTELLLPVDQLHKISVSHACVYLIEYVIIIITKSLSTTYILYMVNTQSLSFAYVV